MSDADEEGDLGQRDPRADAEGMIRQPDHLGCRVFVIVMILDIFT